MGISIFKIKKWAKMLTGKSILHVNQGVGKVYSKDLLKGYYNDLTEKVTKGDYYNEAKVPSTFVDSGDEIYFPIAIYQYGLGAYDLYLLNKEEIMLKKFKVCADWAVNEQESTGSWSTFFYENKKHPYSSMAQGEGISLLLRAYKEFGDNKYIKSAKKAIEFMLKPIEEGGTTKYTINGIYLCECTHDPVILNGWIFSLWGLFDYLKVIEDEKVRRIYEDSVTTLVSSLPEFDNGYWSKYNLGKMITSPFYHKLHIAQLEVMYEITGEEIFRNYSKNWSSYQNKWFNRIRAFINKAFQKLIEK